MLHTHDSKVAFVRFASGTVAEAHSPHSVPLFGLVSALSVAHTATSSVLRTALVDAMNLVSLPDGSNEPLMPKSRYCCQERLMLERLMLAGGL